MADQDIPLLDETITKLPSDIREDLANRGRNDLYFFNKAVMGFHDLRPKTHGPICMFAGQNVSQFKMMLYPRDHLKTSCITIGGSTQRVMREPEARQLIANESATNSERFLRAIRQQAEGNRVLRALYSDRIPKDTRKVRWNDSELDFVREGHYPEPSIDSIGMTGAVTSRHYTHITYDDPISEEAVKSEKVMQDTITRMSAALSLLVNPNENTIWLVGTRWALHDVYSEWIKIFGPKLARLVRACIEGQEPIWPERFSLETLALKRTQMGEYKFSCLMMNNPRNSEIQDLNIQDVRWWAYAQDGETIIMYDLDMSELHRIREDELDITTTVDLAGTDTTTSDRNAIVTVGVTPWNQAIVLDTFARRCDALDVIEYLVYVARRWRPRAVGVESVGYQNQLKTFLKQRLNEESLYMNMVEFPKGYQQKSKTYKIRGLQPYLATGRLYLNGVQHQLRTEMADFPLGEYDDVLDALAMHTQLFRGQMSLAARKKYKDSEEALLRRIRLGIQQPAQPIRGKGNFEPDEFDPEFDAPQFPVSSLIIT